MFRVQVFYIDFGNEEEQPISGLYRMPSELIRLPALCVSLAVDKDLVDVSKYGNTEKNIARVYNILNATERLFVSLNERREATFYDNDMRIHFKLSKKKEKISTGFCLDTIEEGEEAELEESIENPYQEDFVEEVVYSLLQENLVIEELEECLREEEATSPSFIEPCLSFEQDQSVVQTRDLSESISSIQEDCIVANEDENQNLLDGKDENQNVDTVQDKIVEMSPKSLKSSIIEELFETSEGDSAYQSNPTSPKLFEDEASSNDSSLRQTPSSPTAPSSCEGVQGLEGDERKLHTRHSLPASLRFKSSTKLTNRREQRKPKFSGWSIGDPVTAMWTSDGVWRRGIIHDMDRGHAFVIASEEEGIMATRVRIKDLKPATMPMELLNSVEEELLSWSSSRDGRRARRMN